MNIKISPPCYPICLHQLGCRKMSVGENAGEKMMTIHTDHVIIWDTDGTKFEMEPVGEKFRVRVTGRNDGTIWSQPIADAPFTREYSELLLDMLEAARNFPGVNVCIQMDADGRRHMDIQMWLDDPVHRKESEPEPLNACPYCGSDDVEICMSGGGWAFAVCMDCNAHTGLCDNGYFAREAWQEAKITEYDEEMDGELFDL